MSKRAAAVAETRRRIVDAARALHGERGIAATSWDDIAARAGVGVGTVYRHFPSLDELIPACGDVAMEVAALPTPAAFDGAADPADRIARLVGETFAVYERAAPELRVVQHQGDAHPRVAEDRAALDAALGALVDAALRGLRASAEDRAVTRAMIDLGVWDALREQGLDPRARVAAVAGMLASRLL